MNKVEASGVDEPTNNLSSALVASSQPSDIPMTAQQEESLPHQDIANSPPPVGGLLSTDPNEEEKKMSAAAVSTAGIGEDSPRPMGASSSFQLAKSRSEKKKEKQAQKNALKKSILSSSTIGQSPRIVPSSSSFFPIRNQQRIDGSKWQSVNTP
jgi:hypothetical protein